MPLIVLLLQFLVVQIIVIRLLRAYLNSGANYIITLLIIHIIRITAQMITIHHAKQIGDVVNTENI